MAETPYSKFRLGADTLADLDALAASNGGNRSQAIRESVAYWRRMVEAAGRENADALTPEEWTLLGHSQVGSDDLDEVLEERPIAQDWSVRIAQELIGTHDGRPILLKSQQEEVRAAKRLAKKIAGWGVVRGYALYAALRYFWRRPEAGIAACAAPEVWMTPVAREPKP